MLRLDLILPLNGRQGRFLLSNPKPAKVALVATGASGLLGSWVCRELLDQEPKSQLDSVPASPKPWPPPGSTGLM